MAGQENPSLDLGLEMFLDGDRLDLLERPCRGRAASGGSPAAAPRPSRAWSGPRHHTRPKSACFLRDLRPQPRSRRRPCRDRRSPSWWSSAVWPQPRARAVSVRGADVLRQVVAVPSQVPRSPCAWSSPPTCSGQSTGSWGGSRPGSMVSVICPLALGYGGEELGCRLDIRLQRSPCPDRALFGTPAEAVGSHSPQDSI